MQRGSSRCEEPRWILTYIDTFALGEQEDDGDGRGENFCGGDGVPDAVHVEQERQQEDGGSLANKRPQEGDGSGDEAVIERREERGREDIEARKQKRE